MLEVSSGTAKIESKNKIDLKDGEAITLIYDGSNWQIIAKYSPDID